MRLDGMKPKDAQEALLDSKKEVGDFLTKISGEKVIAQEINVGAANEKILKKGKYQISPKDFSGASGIAPRIFVTGNGENFDMKASKLLKKLGQNEEAEELETIYEKYEKMRESMQEDVKDASKKGTEKLKDKTSKNFWRLLNPSKK